MASGKISVAISKVSPGRCGGMAQPQRPWSICRPWGFILSMGQKVYQNDNEVPCHPVRMPAMEKKKANAGGATRKGPHVCRVKIKSVQI